MKRSEMIAILKRELSNASRFCTTDNGTVRYHSVYIDNLLTAIENAGMMPPDNGTNNYEFTYSWTPENNEETQND